MTKRTGTWQAALVAAVVASACSSGTSPSFLIDAGAPDVRSVVDSGVAAKDSGPVATDSGHTPEAGPTPDAGNPGNGDAQAGTYDFPCGNKPDCLLTQVCCINPASMDPFSCVPLGMCPAGDSLNCDGPDECGGATPNCCGTETSTGSGSNCTPGTLGSACSSAASCPTHLASGCPSTTTVVFCHDSPDCTDPTDNKCCTFTSGNVALTFCTDATTATIAGATCHP